VLRAKEHAPIPYPSVVFTFGLAVGSIKEFGGALIILLNHFAKGQNPNYNTMNLLYKKT
jgi:hypothetical protein